jgi:pSer/pThr/pTyr-binding forkhead associated (FHA) protein/RNA polymerase subunit RPABC4/transcription elongation factor Spt4
MDIGLVCDQCNTLSAIGTPRCPRCDASLALEDQTRVGLPALRAPAPPDPNASIACEQCGELVPPNHKFCGGCGARIDSPRPKPVAAAEKPGRRTMFFGVMQAARAKLTLIRGDGLDGVSFTLAGDDHLAGRIDCPLLFPDDPYLSPVHANFFYRDGKLVVRDENSVNGVYVRITAQVELPLGNRFLVGEQMLEVEPLPAIDDSAVDDGTYYFTSPRRGGELRIVQTLRGGDSGIVYSVTGTTARIGREGNDINFPDDPFISGHHAHIGWDNQRLTLTDLGSKNGTFLRIAHERTLGHGDYVFMGQQLLRVEIV